MPSVTKRQSVEDRARFLSDRLHDTIAALLDEHYSDLRVVTQIESPREVRLSVKMPPEMHGEVGRVIGRRGRTINIVRDLFSAIGARLGLKVVVDVSEPTN